MPIVINLEAPLSGALPVMIIEVAYVPQDDKNKLHFQCTIGAAPGLIGMPQEAVVSLTNAIEAAVLSFFRSKGQHDDGMVMPNNGSVQ